MAPLALVDYALFMGTLGAVRPKLYRQAVSSLDGSVSAPAKLVEVGSPDLLGVVAQPRMAGMIAGAVGSGMAAGQAAATARQATPNDPALSPAQNRQRRDLAARSVVLDQEHRALSERVDNQTRADERQERRSEARQANAEKPLYQKVGRVDRCFSFLLYSLVKKPRDLALYWLRNTCDDDIQVKFEYPDGRKGFEIVRSGNLNMMSGLRRQPDNDWGCPLNEQGTFVVMDDGSKECRAYGR